MSRIGKTAITLTPRLIASYFSWLLKCSNHPSKYPLEYPYSKAKNLIRITLKKLNVEVKYEGLENIPNQASLITPNHMSSCDPLMFISIIDRPLSFVAKWEVKSYPFVGRVIKSLEGKFLNREDLKQQLRMMLEVENDLRENKRHWIIFPEGKRIKDPLANLNEFHHGTFRAATKSHAPIVPVASYGSFRVLKNKPKFKKYYVQIKFLKPLYYEDYKDMNTKDIAKYVAELIQKEITYNLRIKDQQLMKENKNFDIYKLL